MEKKIEVYKFSQVAEKLSQASEGKSYSNRQVQGLVKSGKIVRVCPPGINHGVYTKESVDKCCEELNQFYSKFKLAV